MINSQLNRETGIYETFFGGQVSFEEIISYISKLKNAKDYPPKLLILTDAIDSTFELSNTEYRQIAELVRRYAAKFELLKDAIILNDPRATAYSLLIRNESITIPNFRFEIFSTREAAIEWLVS